MHTPMHRARQQKSQQTSLVAVGGDHHGHSPTNLRQHDASCLADVGPDQLMVGSTHKDPDRTGKRHGHIRGEVVKGSGAASTWILIDPD